MNNLCVLDRQLEENINKWSLELEDMEKVFLNQATMVNAWDQMLIKNGAKIVSLNESVAAVRADQQRLEHELDFVASQVCKSFTMSFLVIMSYRVGMKYYVGKTDGNISSPFSKQSWRRPCNHWRLRWRPPDKLWTARESAPMLLLRVSMVNWRACVGTSKRWAVHRFYEQFNISCHC